MGESIKITLRRATNEDHDFLLDLRRKGLEEDVLRVWGTWDDERQRRYIRGLLAGDDLRIVCRDGADIGMLTVEEREGSLHIENIVLLPMFQSRGIGGRLIFELCERTDELGIPATLEVLKVSRARALYERMGFRIVEETDTHYRMERPAGMAGGRSADETHHTRGLSSGKT